MSFCVFQISKHSIYAASHINDSRSLFGFPCLKDLFVCWRNQLKEWVACECDMRSMTAAMPSLLRKADKGQAACRERGEHHLQHISPLLDQQGGPGPLPPGQCLCQQATAVQVSHMILNTYVILCKCWQLLGYYMICICLEILLVSLASWMFPSYTLCFQ